MQWRIANVVESEELFLQECIDIKKEINCFFENHSVIEKYTSLLLLNHLSEYDRLTAAVLKSQLYRTLKYYGGDEVESMESIVDELTDLYKEKVIAFPLKLINHNEIWDFIDNPEFFSYRSFLLNLKYEKKYILDYTSEVIMRLKNTTGYNAMQQLYLSTMEEASFKVKELGRIDYNTIKSFLSYTDKKIRKKAAKLLVAFFSNNNSYFTKLLNYTVQDMIIDMRIRNYESIYDNIYYENELSLKDYLLLEELVVQNLGIFQEYYKIKAKLENKNRNLEASKLKEITERFEIEEAIDIIVSSFNKINIDYGKMVEDLFKNSYVDYECRRGKQSGAICFAAVPEVKPYIFVNYNGTISNLFTLGHELGHAVHLIVSAKKNTAINYMKSNLHTETIAVFFETLVCNEYLERSKYTDIAILKVLDNIVDKLFRQTMNYLFEKKIREYNGYITANQIEFEWQKIRNQFYNNVVKFYSYEKNNYWSIPHFICEPLLTSIYVFSQTIAFNLLNKAEEKDFSKKFHGFLEIGSNDSFRKYLFDIFGSNGINRENWEFAFFELKNLFKRLGTNNE